MQLTSRAFADGDEIPRRYTKDGADVSPPLAWRDVPPGTRSLALVVEDPDAPDPDRPQRTWIHWVVADLPPDLDELPEGTAWIRGSHVGVNDWDQLGWGGPAPPVGRHRYVFRLFALDRALGIDRPTRRRLDEAMRGHVLAEARLIGTYRRARR